MFRRTSIALAAAAAFFALARTGELSAQDYNVAGAYGTYGWGDMDRFYHYPYVTYPQNYWGNEYFRSNGSLYYRYPQEARIPVYNRSWHNYYPSSRRYHWGHQFILDVF